MAEALQDVHGESDDDAPLETSCGLALLCLVCIWEDIGADIENGSSPWEGESGESGVGIIIQQSRV